MKKNISLLIFLFASISIFAQNNYKYAIVPIKNPSIGSGIDPYGISSSVQQIFGKKKIKCIFQTAEIPDDYCESVTVNVEKIQSMLKSKVLVELKDCHNQVVWSGEGTGRSKEFREGYAEAFADAVKDLKELPENITQTTVSRIAPTKPETIIEKVVEPVIEKSPIPTSSFVSSSEEVEETTTIYKPDNLYYNYSYFIDVIENDDDNKKLLIINGELLGYTNLDIIASLTPSGLENVYTVNWTNPNGSKLSGIANFVNNELNISLQDGDTKLVINLQKH